MSEPFSKNLRILAIKDETTNGTPIALADADFDVRCRDIEPTFEVPADEDTAKYATGDHGGDASIMGTQSGTVSFRIKMGISSTSLITDPKWFKIAKGCGLISSAYSTTGIALQDQKAGDNACVTLGIMDIQLGATPAAIKYTYAGAIGNCTIGCSDLGMPWELNATFTGKLYDVEDVINADILALTSPDSTIAEKNLCTTITIGGVSQRLSSFMLDLGNQIAPIPKQSDCTGYEYFGITARNPVFTCNPIMQPVATEDILENVKTSTTKSILIDGVTGGGNFKLRIPVAQLMMPAVADREGYINWDQSWRCLRNAGSDANIADESTFEFLIGARAS